MHETNSQLHTIGVAQESDKLWGTKLWGHILRVDDRWRSPSCSEISFRLYSFGLGGFLTALAPSIVNANKYLSTSSNSNR